MYMYISCYNQKQKFTYGEDGMDGQNIEKQTYDMAFLSNSEFELKYAWNADDKKFMEQDTHAEIEASEAGMELLEEELEQLREDRRFYRRELAELVIFFLLLFFLSFPGFLLSWGQSER